MRTVRGPTGKRALGRWAGFLALLLCMLLLPRADLRAQGLEAFGYADLEWTLEQRGTDEQGDVIWKHAFDNHHFNLILLGWLMDDVGAGLEIEYEHAGEEIAVEYAYLQYSGIKNLRIVGGKFIVPFNRWNKDVHPTWISKMPSRPLPNANIFPSTYSDVGLWLSGAAPLGSGTRFVWDAYIVNGLEGEADASSWRGLRDNDRERPRRGNDKALGGRIGVELAQGLGLGISGYTGEYAADETTEEGLRLSFLGADVDYRYENLELRAEGVLGYQDVTTSEDTNNRSGFYAQAAYTIDTFEPVARYEWVDFEENEDDAHALGLGFSWYFSQSMFFRLGYFFVWERDSEFERDNDRLMSQLVVVF